MEKTSKLVQCHPFNKGTQWDYATFPVQRGFWFGGVIYIGLRRRFGTISHIWFRGDSGIEGACFREVSLY